MNNPLFEAIASLRPGASFAVPGEVAVYAVEPVLDAGGNPTYDEHEEPITQQVLTGHRAPTLADVQWYDEAAMPTQAEVDAALDAVWRNAVIAEFKAEREKLLNRMMSIAGRVARAGETAFASALDWMAEQIIPLDAHPLVLAATDADSMRNAFTDAYKALVTQALTPIPNGGQFAPDMDTALAWKVEVDKVFK